jgi:hypothetical protein
MSWRSKAQVVISPRSLDRVAGFKWSVFGHIMMNWWSWSCYSCTVQNSVSIILPAESSVWIFFGFRWILMAPRFACCLFLTGSNGPTFHLQSLCAEETHPLQFDSASEVLYRFLQFWCELSWDPSCTQFVVLECMIRNMLSRAMANAKFHGNLISYNVTVFSYHSFNMLHSRWCIGSVRPTWVISISYTWRPILALPFPLVHLLQG